MKSILYLLLLLTTALVFCQDNDDFAKRLKALNNQTIIFYNVDGVEFSSQTFSNEFSEKGLKKIYRKYSINDSDLKVQDKKLENNNFYITKSENVAENVNQISSYYFVENKSKTVSVFWFGYFGALNQDFERKYVNLILENKIPNEVFESMTIESIDFAGRQLELGNSCYWTNINTVQCPYYGEMNWSVHKNIESAKNSIHNQFTITKNKKGGKVLSEEEVDVLFEGTETKAKKVIYDFTGSKSLLAGMSGGKTLTIYYVACQVRENYVSCCMSFWNNDTITVSGLSPLLEKVMQLK
jgi:archaellum component FlaF (FlaF/FlaG flagellin family)